MMKLVTTKNQANQKPVVNYSQNKRLSFYHKISHLSLFPTVLAVSSPPELATNSDPVDALKYVQMEHMIAGVTGELLVILLLKSW